MNCENWACAQDEYTLSEKRSKYNLSFEYHFCVILASVHLVDHPTYFSVQNQKLDELGDIGSHEYSMINIKE